MNLDQIKLRYLDRLIAGDRNGSRKVLGEALQTGTPATIVYTELFWPIMSEIESLYREHRINRITQQIAVRINRTLVDQLQSKLPTHLSRNKKIIVICADDEPEELGAQMCADLFESDGWEVKFLGGGIPNDEIITLAGIMQPDIVFIYGTKPSGAPDVRRLIDAFRDMGSCPNTRIMLSGGIFNRAEGLWEEIGADLFAPTAMQALQIALSDHRSAAPKRRGRRSASKEELFEEEPSLMAR